MDGNGAWVNHSVHLAIGSRSLMISTKNPHGWTVKWNRDKFGSNDNRHTMRVLHKMIKDQKRKMRVLLQLNVQICKK
jgi:hypothetical protein